MGVQARAGGEGGVDEEGGRATPRRRRGGRDSTSPSRRHVPVKTARECARGGTAARQYGDPAHDALHGNEGVAPSRRQAGPSCAAARLIQKQAPQALAARLPPPPSEMAPQNPACPSVTPAPRLSPPHPACHPLTPPVTPHPACHPLNPHVSGVGCRRGCDFFLNFLVRSAREAAALDLCL